MVPFLCIPSGRRPSFREFGSFSLSRGFGCPECWGNLLDLSGSSFKKGSLAGPHTFIALASFATFAISYANWFWVMGGST